ncbi:uncharacterized protein BDV17DRAFT_251822 [Aspergillus undulatus]|uniref:uncharacterized protein n=1 Tax=Aspergillus undulatus TaxID=1810928 RepID=UPI003CCDC528
MYYESPSQTGPPDDRNGSQEKTDTRKKRHSAVPKGVSGTWSLRKVFGLKSEPPPVTESRTPSKQSGSEGKTESDAQGEPLTPPVAARSDQQAESLGEMRAERPEYPDDERYRRMKRQLEAQIVDMNADIDRLKKELQTSEASKEAREAELRQRDTVVQELSHKVDYLQEKQQSQKLNSVLVGRRQDGLQPLLAGSSRFTPKEDRAVRDELYRIRDKVRLWAKKHSISSLETLSANDKESVMYSLCDDYCLCSDWETMANKMSIPQGRIATVLVQALLAKDVFGRLLADPFFAFLDIESGQGDLVPRPDQMRALHDLMKQVNEPASHIWRSNTIRNLSARSSSASTTQSYLGSKLDGICNRFVTEFLAGPAHALLNENDRDAHSRELRSLYKSAAQLALALWSQRSFIATHKLHDLPWFTVTSALMEVHRLQHLDEDDTSMDGKGILLVVQPAVLAFGSEDADRYDEYKVWAPAVVLVYSKQE